MSSRDGAERLLAVATSGLPAHRARWGAAMRAELDAIDDAGARRRFARSAAGAAFGGGYGLLLAASLGTAVVVAAIALISSRFQLDSGGPGVLSVTVPLPPLLLFAVAAVTALIGRSFRFGILAGLLAFVASFAAVSVVVATEGLLWMDRRGVFVLDADPPKSAVGVADVVFDLFSTGMWLGHVLFWLPWPIAGAALGAWLAARKRPPVASG